VRWTKTIRNFNKKN